jgi:hypothetical protein
MKGLIFVTYDTHSVQKWTSATTKDNQTKARVCREEMGGADRPGKADHDYQRRGIKCGRHFCSFYIILTQIVTHVYFITRSMRQLQLVPCWTPKRMFRNWEQAEERLRMVSESCPQSAAAVNQSFVEGQTTTEFPLQHITFYGSNCKEKSLPWPIYEQKCYGRIQFYKNLVWMFQNL